MQKKKKYGLKIRNKSV